MKKITSKKQARVNQAMKIILSMTYTEVVDFNKKYFDLIMQLAKMAKIIITSFILINLVGCSKEYSANNNCGRVLNKIHEGSPSWSEQPPRNEIWAIAVSVTDSTERWVGVDSSTWNGVKIGDRWCN